MSRLIIVLAILCCASAAQADRDAGWVLGVQTGIGTPLGSIGVEGGVAITPSLTWTAGFGLGLGSEWQFATMLRKTSQGAGSKWGVGGGLSTGGWDGMVPFLSTYRLDAEWLSFVNLEVNWQYQFNSGALIRLSLGGQRSFQGEITCTISDNGDPDDCDNSKPAQRNAIGWPYLALGVEY